MRSAGWVLDRGTAGSGSDVDLVVSDIQELLDDDRRLSAFGEVAAMADEDWGLVRSRRVQYVDGLDVEFGTDDPGLGCHAARSREEIR